MSRLNHPFVWLVRRELWENRAILLAPPAVGLLLAVGFLLSLMIGMNDGNVPYRTTMGLIALGTGLVALSTALDALHGERRERTILFWKSLPVSDLATVLSKLALPVLVAPAVAFISIVATHLVMWAIAAVLMTGPSGEGINLAAVWVVAAYTLVATTLWYVPLFAWLILISALARRMLFLWAAGIPIALNLAESAIFGTDYVAEVFKDRVVGVAGEAFASLPFAAPDDLSALNVLGFLSSPGLWLGLAAAAALVAGAAYARRVRQYS